VAGSAGNRHRHDLFFAWIAALLGFSLAALITDKVLHRVWPDHHDLSDIGTGFLILALSFSAGVVAGCLAAAAVRFGHRRHPTSRGGR
jgi:hypothetical protein